MNIIIAGAGKVGFNLARTLSIGNNVTIIDHNKEALRTIQESLDIMPISGDVEDSKTYEHFIDKKIDLFIAVTNIDNVNLVSTLMADSVLQINRKIVRVQNHFYADSLVQKKLGINTMVYPIKLASQAIVSLVNYPMANNVKFFKHTQHKLISMRTSKTMQAMHISSEHFIIAGIEREKSFFVPQSDTLIMPNDLVYFFGLEESIQDVCSKFNLNLKKHIQKCVVFGANDLGIAISQELLNVDRDVKLVEKDLKLCEKADEVLAGRASVIHLKYGIYTLFEDEGLASADIFVSATDNDEYNIAKCLEAREKGIQKVMAINNEMEYYSLMHSLGIIVIRGPKMSAYSKIIEEIGSAGLVLEKHFCGSKANVLMRNIFQSSPLIKKEIKPLKVKQSLLFIMRNENLIQLTEKFILEENDSILAFCEKNESPKVKQWIYEL